MSCAFCGAKKTRPEWSIWGQSFCRRSCRNCYWVEEVCIVPRGKLVGQPVKLGDFQVDVFRGIYDSPTRRLIFSVGRKNAKTATATFIVLLHLCGPEAEQNSAIVSTAMSRDQAAIIYSLASKIVRLSVELESNVTCRDTLKELYCPEMGTLYKRCRQMRLLT